MRLDDHLMTVLTGLILAVTVGFIAQKSDAIMDMVSAKPRLAATEDSFTLRAGRDQRLDILLNDGVREGMDVALRIVTRPACGRIEERDFGVVYSDSEGCSGMVSFSYCLESEGRCDPAAVLLNVRGDTRMASAHPASAAEPEPLRALVVSIAQPAAAAQETPEISFERLAIFAADTSRLSLDAAPAAVGAKVAGDAPVRLDPILSASLVTGANKGATLN